MEWRVQIQADCYRHFRVGERVKYEGKEHIIESTIPPSRPGDEGVVFLKGERYGVLANQVIGCENFYLPPSLEDPEALLREIAATPVLTKELRGRIRELLNPSPIPIS